MQQNIDISLINYKFPSKRYIIYESNGIAKEYTGFDSKLIFKGEYKNGLRNGKGTEYDRAGELMFEGEYLNGLRNGQGKEYSLGKLVFEGEFLNGKKNGKGKEYFDGELKYEGEYKNGERIGKGKEYEKGKLKRESIYISNAIRLDINEEDEIKYKDNLKVYGKEYYNHILVFEGEYLNRQRNGKGKEYDCYNNTMEFEGEYLNGKRNGRGKEYRNEKLIFEGEYLNDKKWNGILYDVINNEKYELKNGNGFFKEYYINGGLDITFDGEYKNGNRDGKGKELSDGKITFEGEYKNGERNGKGKGKLYVLHDNKYTFEGEYLNGIKNGKGKVFYDGKLIFNGEYLYDKRRKGKEYLDGKLEYEGEYMFNRKWNGKGYDENGNITYEIIDGNGKIKEYHSNGKLKFEGEILNGLRN